MNPKYVVITPARDEEDHIEGVVQSMVDQTVRPTTWVIVNDGSTDRTAELLDRAAEGHDWIRAVHREDRGFRAAGGGVMEAFYAGLEAVEDDDWEFLVKLDGDLQFENDYFERCLREFEKDPKLGVGGGVIKNRIGDQLVLERVPAFHVRGATKIYRRACWDAIEGLIAAPGWDTLDEVKANYLGWSSRSFDDVVLIQERFTGDAAGQWRNWVKNGKAAYITGYHPLFLMSKAGVRALRRPYLKASLGLVWGYFGAPLSGVKKGATKDVVRYVRQQQLRRLMGRSTIWR
ncbi:MAG: glycosyltransferase family A protein [Planctomycetota bacterium]